MLYLCSAYLHLNGAVLNTALPLMVFQDEIMYVPGASTASGLVCRSHDGTTPSWHHPYNLVVQNVNVKRAHTMFAQVIWRDTTKLVYAPDLDIYSSHSDAYGLYTCRVSSNLFTDITAIGVYRRNTGNEKLACTSDIMPFFS